jgi:fructose/tagatose bisphosphate aldolase
MSIATFEQYCAMLDNAKRGHFAYPGINVSGLDTQYAFTRPIVDHVLRNYDGVLKVDGEVGEKKAYDPRAYLKQATAGMKQRVIDACADLRSTGSSLLAR